MWRPETEAMTQEALQKLQTVRLRRLVRRLESAVPFYRDRLRARGVAARNVRSLAYVQRLPFTTRTDLRDQYPLGLLAVPPDQVARFHATSGSRGKPTLVAYTAQDLRTWSEFAARMLYAAGARPGDVWYVASSYGLFSGGMGAHYGLERLGAAVVPVSSGNTLRLVQLMADVGPAGIHCVPTYMLRIAEVAREAGIDPRHLGLRYGSYGGETWSEPLRRRIEDLFGLEAYDVYGLAECYGPGVAYECETRDGLHLSEDQFLFEIVDPARGEPVPDGQEGELVITTLTKQAMPLLRYRTGDLTRILSGTCSCGRTFRRMARVSGRSDDMLIIRGVNLYPSEVERVLLGFPEVAAQHRLLVERTGAMDSLTLEAEVPGLELPSDAADELSRRIRLRLRQELGVGAVIRLVAPGTLPRSEGKAARVLDLRPKG